MSVKEKDSILGITRENPKYKHHFTWKLHKSEIELLLYQCKTFEEGPNAEDKITSKEYS